MTAIRIEDAFGTGASASRQSATPVRGEPIARAQWIVSLDVGMVNDPSALCIMQYFTRAAVNDEYWAAGEAERAMMPEPPKEWFGMDAGGSFLKYALAPARLHVHHLERLPLGTTYPTQIDYMRTVLRQPPFDRVRPEFLLDMTGVGSPVKQFFERGGVPAIGINITSGDTAIRHPKLPNVWNVPKLLLVSRLQSAMHEGILKIPAELPEAAVVEGELLNFRASFTDTGAVRLSHRDGEHDDLVLALAIAVFWASREFYAMQVGTYYA